jgi:hypothetical protein
VNKQRNELNNRITLPPPRDLPQNSQPQAIAQFGTRRFPNSNAPKQNRRPRLSAQQNQPSTSTYTHQDLSKQHAQNQPSTSTYTHQDLSKQHAQNQTSPPLYRSPSQTPTPTNTCDAIRPSQGSSSPNSKEKFPNLEADTTKHTDGPNYGANSHATTHREGEIDT